MSELVIAPDNELLNGILHNPNGRDWEFVSRDTVLGGSSRTGWHFGAGNPEYWRYADQLVIPGGDVLDIGMEYGRSSFFFATQGMRVRGLDLRPDTVAMVNQMAAEVQAVLPFDVKAKVGDAFETDLGTDAFDIVVLDHTLHHLPSKKTGLELIDKAYTAVKPGGHLWIRALGKESAAYTDMRYGAQAGDPYLEIVDDDVIKHPCTCSGYYQLDPTLFFDQTELLQRFVLAGARIVDSQLLPTEGYNNVMFGEDYNREQHIAVGGMITLLAQKPSVN